MTYKKLLKFACNAFFLYLVGGEFLTMNGREAYDNVLTLRIDDDVLDDLEDDSSDSSDSSESST